MSVNRKSRNAVYLQHGSLKKRLTENNPGGSYKGSRKKGKGKKSNRKRKFKNKGINILITEAPKPKQPIIRFTNKIDPRLRIISQ